MKMPDSHTMATERPCTAGPQHLMVNQGRSEQHFADLYACACGLTRIGNRDEHAARYRQTEEPRA